MSYKIYLLELNNWKSYGGNVILGPFFSFQAIIGPNGSGKSNIMDALCFVLGMSVDDLRAKKESDFIYKDVLLSQSDEETYVQLTLRNEEEGDTILRRTIDGESSSSNYRVNGKEVNFDDYLKILETFNIYPKIKNFLVFQGSIDSIANKSGKEITNIIEMISGSIEFAKDYERYLKEEKEAREITMFQYQKKRGITVEKSQYEDQQKEAEKYNELIEELKEITIQYFLFQLWYIEKEIIKLEEEKNEQNSIIENLDKEKDEINKKKEEEIQKQAEMHQSYMIMENSIIIKKRKIEELKPGNIKKEQEINLKKNKIVAYKEELGIKIGEKKKT